MAELRIVIPDRLEAKLQSAMPDYLDRKGFVCLLLDNALDGTDTLGLAKRSEQASPSSSSIPKSINSNKNKNKGRKQADYPDAFTQFWKLYQGLPKKASKQSKPLALQAWTEATEFTDHGDLMTAVERQIGIQQNEIAAEGRTVCMPDCFRWLRDECYVALLENHAPAHREGDWI